LSPRRLAPLLAALVVAGAGARPAAAQEAGGPAPDFTLPDLQGHPVRLADLLVRGPVVMAFFATWCVPCAAEVPSLSALQERYRDKGLTVLGVSLDEADTLSEVRSFVRRLPFSYPVLLDTEGRVAALYNPEHAMPLTVVIGRERRIRHVHRGYTPGDEVLLEEEVRALLEAPEEAGAGEGVAWGITTLARAEHDRGFAGEDVRNAGFLRTQVDGEAAGVSASVRYDVETFHTEPRAGQLRGRPGFVSVDWATDHLRLHGGDTYAVLGRGLLLHLNRVGAFGVETDVLGGQVEADAGPLSGRLFGGVTRYVELPAILEEGRFVDCFAPIAGARLEARFDELKLGLHGLHVREPGDAGRLDGFWGPDPEAEGVSGGGLSVEAGGQSGAHVYAELVGTRADGGDGTGLGLYWAFLVPVGRLTLTVEDKRYQDLALTYQKRGEGGAILYLNSPPTLEPSDLSFKTAPDTTNAEGTRLRLDLELADGWTLFGSASGVRQQSDQAGQRHTLFHPILGLEASPEGGGRYTLSGGYRSEDHPNNPLLQADWLHAEAKALVPLGGPHSLDVVAQWKLHGLQAEAEQDALLMVTYALAPVVEVGLGVDHRETPVPGARHGNHPFGTLTWRPNTASALTLFAGSDPGGLRCTSGICRQLPEFRGARLEASLRF